MIKSYLKLAWRNLFKSKLFSFVNIFGLAIGLAAFWMILLYIGYELSFDRFHANADRIYRVAQHNTWATGSMHVPLTSAPFAQALLDDYQEIEEVVRINTEGGGIISYQDEKLLARDIYFVDSSFFKVFSFEFLHGDPASSLNNPQSIVLTETLATKLFGDPSLAVGNHIVFQQNYENVVTGVISDIPDNSHLKFSALRSIPNDYTNGWQNFDLYTYILLHKNADKASLERKLPSFFEKHLLSEMGETDFQLELQPLTSIHLYSQMDYELSANGNIDNIYIFISAAVLILLIAAINYMNLTAARSALRVREVGVRKVIGAGRGQLVALFLFEAFLVSLFAVLLAVLFSELFLPVLKAIAEVEFSLWQYGVGNTLLVLFALFLGVGLVCGIYPALFLSGFKTASALKGQLGNVNTNITIRKSMVVFQFVIAVIMITGSWVIYNQLQYVLKKDLGFNKDQVLTFHLSSQETRQKVDVLKSRLLQNPQIKAVSAASNPLGSNFIGGQGYFFERENGEMTNSSEIFQQLSIDEDFVQTLELDILKGRNISPTQTAEVVLVNEALVKKAGWENPIGKKIVFNINAESPSEAVVIGVVNDFHFYSLQHAIAPLVIHKAAPEDQDNVYVKIASNDTKKALAFIETTYKKLDPATPLEFNFLDANYARQYESEQRQGNLLLVFTVLAVFLAVLGLFGLSAFSAEQRNKEIGIRKILGAPVWSLVALLSKDLMKLVLIAVVIACPLAWIAMDEWLQNFSYRIEIAWWLFVLTGMIIGFIAWTTISYRSVKTALANPVDSLKEE